MAAVAERKELSLLVGQQVDGFWDTWRRWESLPEWKPARWYEDKPRRQDCQEPNRPSTPRRDRSPITRRGFGAGRTPKNAGRRYPASPPSSAEVMRMLSLLGNGKVGRRNHALLVCMWRSGVRVSEALALRPSNVDFDDLTVTVESGKGGKYRVVGIDPWGAEQIRAWLPVRDELNVGHGAPLFCTVCWPDPGNTLHSAYVRTLCRELASRADVQKRFAPHQPPPCPRSELGPREGSDAPDPTAARALQSSERPRRICRASHRSR